MLNQSIKTIKTLVTKLEKATISQTRQLTTLVNDNLHLVDLERLVTSNTVDFAELAKLVTSNTERLTLQTVNDLKLTSFENLIKAHEAEDVPLFITTLVKLVHEHNLEKDYTKRLVLSLMNKGLKGNFKLVVKGSDKFYNDGYSSLTQIVPTAFKMLKPIRCKRVETRDSIKYHSTYVIYLTISSEKDLIQLVNDAIITLTNTNTNKDTNYGN